MVPVPGIHTNNSDCFCIDYYSLCPCYARGRLIEWGLSVLDNSVLDESSVEVTIWDAAKKFINGSRCENCKILLKAGDNDIAHDA